MLSLCCAVAQTIFGEQSTVNQRTGDLVRLASQISSTLDANDQETLNESVQDIRSRLEQVTAAASRRETTLTDGKAAWSHYQVSTLCQQLD